MAEVEAAMEVIAEVEVREEEEQLSIADDIISCNCTGVCWKRSSCPCKHEDRRCTPLCTCGRRKACKNKPSLVTMGIVGDQQTQDQQMGLGGGTGVQAVPSYEQNLQDIESYISGLDGNSVRTLCFRLLEGHGGVSLAKSILEATPEGPEPSIPNRSPDWCICGNCLPMPSPIENVCCRRRHCITRYDVFQLICLHPVVLRVAVRNNCDWRADPIIYSHSNFRKAAYRQYILWVYGRLGRGNRRVAPSCVVCRIRSRYPSSYGTYLGFRDV